MKVVNKGNSAIRSGSRLLALILTLAMIVGIMPSALAAGEVSPEAFYGNVAYYTSGGTLIENPEQNPVETGERFTVKYNLMYGNTAQADNKQFWLHFTGAPSDSFVLERFPRMEDGLRVSAGGGISYTLHEIDDGGGAKHWAVEIQGLTGGDTSGLSLDAYFKTTALNGTKLTVTLKDQNGTPVSVNYVGGSNTADIYAKSDAVLENSISANPVSARLGTEQTTLNQSITYTINEITRDSQYPDYKLDNGEARISSYVFEDKVELPAGTFITQTGTDEQTIKSLYTLDGGTDYTVKDVIHDNSGNITGFTVVSNTKVNDSPADEQMHNKTHTAVIDGTKINTPPTTFNSGSIKSTVVTHYNMPNYDGTTTAKDTDPRSASTSITRDGNGIGGASKEFKYGPNTENFNPYDTKTKWVEWKHSTNRPVVAGDLLVYEISVENNTSVSKTYTITDDLAAVNLEFVKLDTGSSADHRVEENGVDIFTLTVQPNQTGTVRFLARVKVDQDGTIINTATVTLDSFSVPVEAQPIVQEKKRPDLAVSKTADNIENASAALSENVYAKGIPFYYTIKVKNNGTEATDSVTVEDVLPEGIVFDGQAASVILPDSGESFAWNAANRKFSTTVVGGLAVGEEKTIKLIVKVGENVVGSPEITNVVVAKAGDETETAEVKIEGNTTEVGDLVIHKTANPSVVHVGDTVEYTIKLHNPKNGPLTHATAYIKDVLPSGIEYLGFEAVSPLTNDNISYTTTTDGNPVFTLSNITVLGNSEVSFKIRAKITDSIAQNVPVRNTAELYTEETLTWPPVNTDGADVTNSVSVADSPVKVEKKAYDSAGNDISGKKVAANTEVTFKIRITNNSDQTVNNVDLTDTFLGQLRSITGDKGVYIDSLSVGSSVSYYQITKYWPVEYDIQSQSAGYKLFDHDLNEVEHSVFDLKFIKDPETPGSHYELTLAPGGSIVLSYIVKTGESWAGGSNTATIDFWVNNEEKTDSSTVVLHDPSWTEPTPSGDPSEPDPSDYPALVMTKTAAKKAVTVSNLDDSVEQDIKTNGKFEYTVSLKNTSDKDYTATDPVFTDKLPAGFGLDITSANAYNNYTGGGTFAGDAVVLADIVNDAGINTGEHLDVTPLSITLKTDSESKTLSISRNQTQTALGYTSINTSYAVLTGNELEIKYNGTLTIPAGMTLKLKYTLAPVQDEITSITAERASNSDNYFRTRSYKNEVTFESDTYFNTVNANGEPVNLQKKITDVETVQIIARQIHPGIEKEPEYTFAVGAHSPMEYGTGTVRTGHYIVWKVRVYNDRDASGGGDDMENYKVTEAYPDGYVYAGKTFNGTNMTYNASIKKYSADGTSSVLTYVDPTGANYNEFSFNGDAYKLSPGEWLEFDVITKPQNENSVEYGRYVNTVTLTVEGKTIHADAVVSGTQDGGGIIEDGEVPIWPVGTTSKKSVKKNESGYTVNSFSQAGSNRVKTTQGDVVTYKLDVKNIGGADNDKAVLEDFCIIDRLPYEGDVGVITTAPRGSGSSVRFAGKDTVKATVTFSGHAPVVLTQDYLDISFANDTEHVFLPTDTDWSYKSRNGESSVQWYDNDTDPSMKLVRFALKNLENYSDESGNNPFRVEGSTVYGLPKDAEISIEFDATVPEHIENTGEAVSAWNSFAYYFNSEGVENMVSEPAKVGSWVEDSSQGGTILVRKRYKSNMPGEQRRFYFAIFDTPYSENDPQPPLDTLYIDLKGSENYSENEAYFSNLDFGSGKSYYIYETDADYKPLVAINTERGSLTHTNKLNGTETVTQDHVIAKTAQRSDGFKFIMDNRSQADAELLKAGTWDQGKIALYESNYLVWQKDLDQSKTLNSAVFINDYEAKIEPKVMGPFYADVATDQTKANYNAQSSNTTGNNDMLSSRPGEGYEFGDVLPEQATADRANTSGVYKDYGNGTTYGSTVRFGDDEEHTIATAFLAELTGIGDYTVNKVKWNITFNDSQYKDSNNVTRLRSADGKDPGVFVRLRSTASQLENEKEVSLFNLTEYMAELGINPEEQIAERIGDAENELTGAETNAADGSMTFDGEDRSETIDDVMFSSMTKEEAEEMFAAELGLDIANMTRNEYGEAVFVMDEETGELLDSTAASETVMSLSPSGFNDATDNDRKHTIYKLDGSTAYGMELTDPFPRVTLGNGTKVYVGIVIDQLYDRHASATLELSDEPEYEDSTVVESAKNIEQKHTSLTKQDKKSLLVGNHGVFMQGSTIYRLTAGKSVTFDNIAAGAYDHDVVTDSFMLKAASGKPVTVKASTKAFEGGSTFNSLVSLEGQGSLESGYRVITVNSAANQTLKIYAVSGSAAAGERTLTVEYKDASGNVKKETFAPSTVTAENAAVFTTQTIGAAGPVYIYSNKGGIDVYAISAE